MKLLKDPSIIGEFEHCKYKHESLLMMEKFWKYKNDILYTYRCKKMLDMHIEKFHEYPHENEIIQKIIDNLNERVELLTKMNEDYYVIEQSKINNALCNKGLGVDEETYALCNGLNYDDTLCKIYDEYNYHLISNSMNLPIEHSISGMLLDYSGNYYIESNNNALNYLNNNDINQICASNGILLTIAVHKSIPLIRKLTQLYGMGSETFKGVCKYFLNLVKDKENKLRKHKEL